MKEAAPQANWVKEAESRIYRSDIEIILVGPYTYKAPGVLKEVAIARRLRKPIVQIIGYRDSNPKPVPNGGRLLRWTWANMTSVLS